MAITLDGTNGITTPDLAVDTNTLVVDAVNNRVGVGTSSPASVLHVVGSGNPTLTLSGSDGDYTSILNLQAAAGGGSIINATGATSNALMLSTSNTERMRIDSVGNVTLPFQPSIYLDGNNPTNLAFSDGQNFLTSVNYIQRHVRGGISWNPSNGRVTVAVAGHYMVSFAAFRNSNIPARIQIRKNDGVQQLHHSEVNGTNSVSFVLAMAANDFFTVVADGFSLPTCFMGAIHTYFTAHLLG